MLDHIHCSNLSPRISGLDFVKVSQVSLNKSFLYKPYLAQGAPWCWNIKDTGILHYRLLIQCHMKASRYMHSFLAVAVDLLTWDQCYWSSYTDCRIKWKRLSEISVSLTSILKAYILLNKMSIRWVWMASRACPSTCVNEAEWSLVSKHRKCNLHEDVSKMFISVV